MNVFITGASTGIGESCALYLEERGFRVFAGVRKQEDAQRLESHGVHPVFLDVTKPEQLKEAFTELDSKVGDEGLLGLVNNAGVVVGGPLEAVTLDAFRHQFEVNVFGQLAVIQTMLPLLRRYAAHRLERARTPTARVVNMSSMAGKVAQPFMSPYCASKHALEAISDCLRYELKPWRIHCSAVEPGAIQTPIWQKGRKALRSMVDDLSPKMSDLYGAGITRIEKMINHAASKAVSPELVAECVYHALSNDTPKTRYSVGPDAKMNVRLRKYLPDTWFDWMIYKMTGLGKIKPSATAL